MRIVPLVLAALMPVTTAIAAFAAETPAIVMAARQRVEASDFRATGRLVQVDAAGKRISSGITIEAHWFPGVLRVLVEIVPPKKGTGDAGQDQRVSILLEMKPSGHSTIQVFHPHQPEPVTLPFDKWGESVAGTNFNYEDFLQPEYYWQVQTILRSAKCGARDCDILKSAPAGSERSHYTEVQSSLDQTIAYPVSVEKTLKDGGAVKDFTYLGLTKSGGVWASRQVEVKQQGKPGSTLLLVERGSTKANLGMKDFSAAQISRFEDHP